MNADNLIALLNDAFDYTEDNNRDLIADTVIPLDAVIEELKVHEAYNFLIAYTIRNRELIDANLLRSTETNDIIDLNREGKEAL